MFYALLIEAGKQNREKERIPDEIFVKWEVKLQWIAKRKR